MSQNRPGNVQLQAGNCPDEKCGNVCFFPSDQSKVECTKCGQVHTKENLTEKRESLSAMDLQSATIDLVKQGRKDAEAVKVNGLSNYQCKLISSLMTYYGLDRESGNAKLLSTLPGNNETFDCSKLSDRAFIIEEKCLGIQGYGIDPIAKTYLSSVLEEVKNYNNLKTCPLIPIHADGDGHCLVHAISRCISGRELFWHPLMTNLKGELNVNLMKYQMQFSEFVEQKEWEKIIAEADPYFQPSSEEPTGLRNIHIFALANVLHRPIILLDAIDGLQSFADYSGLFLPVFVPPEACREKDGTPNKPLAIAWSSKGRNHFVPLVGVKGQQVCRLPGSLIPKVWGGFQDFVSKYLDLAVDQSCVIGGNNSIKDTYLQGIVSCMEKKFKELNGLSAAVVADYYHTVIKPSNIIDLHCKTAIEEAKKSIKEESLHKCINCGLLINYEIGDEQLQFLLPGGKLYEIAKEAHKVLQNGLKYYFPLQNVTCRYDANKDRLFFHINEICHKCNGDMRLVDEDGFIKYRNGDSVLESKNLDEKKIFWDGCFYDHLPEKITVDLSWKDNILHENVFWFYKEKDQSRNSNAFEIAQRLVQKHYPSEFGSNHLVHQLSNQIFQLTSHLKQGYYSQDFKPSNYASDPTPETKTKRPNQSKSQTRIKDAAVNKKKTEQKQPPISCTPQNAVTKDTQNAQPLSLPAKQLGSESPPKSIIRLSAKGKNATVDLPSGVTYPGLQKMIEDKLGIACKCQRIKAGFPPRLIKPPSNENDPVPLKHGDRVLVEEIEELDVATGIEQSNIAASTTKSKSRNSSGTTKMDKKSFPDVFSEKGNGADMPDRGLDLWEPFADRADCFKRGGMIFSLIEKNFDTLNNGDHLQLPFFPNQVLCYDASADEIQICLGERHISVQPLSDEQLRATSNQLEKYNTATNTPKCNASYSADGARRSETKLSIIPFSGEGKSLGSLLEKEKLVDDLCTSKQKPQDQSPAEFEDAKIGKNSEDCLSVTTKLPITEDEGNDEFNPKCEENLRDDSGIASDNSVLSSHLDSTTDGCLESEINAEDYKESQEESPRTDRETTLEKEVQD